MADRRKLGPKEISVDVGGYSLYARLMGTGKPGVVFECGLGDDVNTWNRVQPEIAELTSTLTYDRAGLGDSQPSPQPRDIESMVSDLHALLGSVQIPAPYLLVGHSLGGFIVRMFAFQYPDLVSGLVLVDPSHEGFQGGRKEMRSPEEWDELEKERVARMLDAPSGPLAELREFQHSMEQMAAVTWQPNIPVTILTSTRFGASEQRGGLRPEDKRLWAELHAGWLKQVPGARHILTDQSGHYIQWEEPELVIDAIRGMIEGGT
jgi:pimeloyl-ACP methyl ester carboxylesterase